MQQPTVEIVRFNASDLDWAVPFAKLDRTAEYGLRKFPEPPAYHQLVRQLAEQPGAPDRTRLSALAQRDWHTRGQTGCQFARLVAKDADTIRWDYLVVDHRDVSTPEAASEIVGLVDACVADPHVEVVSILLPNLDAPAGVTAFIRALTTAGEFWLERDEIIEDRHRLFVRYPIDARTQAWVMAFAPFTFMPNTRRGPYVELAIRVKSKPEWVFHRSSQERDVAHLADTPLTMSDQHWEDRWWATKRRTTMILGAPPDSVSAAKSTFTVPLEQRF